MARHKVIFQPSERVFFADNSETILETAMKAGIHINASCGGNASCGRCKVKILEGAIDGPYDPKIPKDEFDDGVRLACTTVTRGDIVVEIPLESQIDRSVLERKKEAPHILSVTDTERLVTGWEIDPPVFKKFLKLPPPTPDDNISDAERVFRALKEVCGTDRVTMGLRTLRELPKVLRRLNWNITTTLMAVHDGYEVINIESGQQDMTNYSIVVDVGTTTICGQLLDLANCTVMEGFVRGENGRDYCVLAEYSDYNAQISFGEDVISRIHHGRKREGLKRLQESVATTINGVIRELLKIGNIEAQSITHIVMAGNTTMMHLLLGLSPEPIMLAPYTPTAVFMPVVACHEIGVQVNRHARIFLFPSVASYVGGDIVAGVLGSGMYYSEEVTLFMDIGTNGEIVLGNKDWLTCSSCSAGPAFEGGGIQFGMRAGRGAIEQVRINQVTFEPMILTIGKVKPIGICGSGLIDLLAELFETGLIDQKGRLRRDTESPRVREGENGYEYVLVRACDTGTGKDIVLTEVDMDNLIRTKAAIYAGCRVLLESVGLTFGDVQKVIIAGGFGHSIDPWKARMIGLVPEMPLERFLFVGNGSLLGARLASFSKKFLNEADRIARMMTNIELSNSSRFMDEFVAAMFLPHTDMAAFPSVLNMIRRT